MREGHTTIFKLADQGEAAELERRLAAGGDPNELWEAHDPLEASAYGGHLEACQVLLKYGARVDYQDPDIQRSALHAAAGMGHADVVALLLAHGAPVEARMSAGETPLIWAATAVDGRRAEVTHLLLEAGANPAAIDASGNLAVHMAAMYANLPAIFVLQERFDGRAVRNVYDQTPADMAAEQERDDEAFILRVSPETPDVRIPYQDPDLLHWRLWALEYSSEAQLMILNDPDEFEYAQHLLDWTGRVLRRFYPNAQGLVSVQEFNSAVESLLAYETSDGAERALAEAALRVGLMRGSADVLGILGWDGKALPPRPAPKPSIEVIDE